MYNPTQGNAFDGTVSAKKRRQSTTAEVLPSVSKVAGEACPGVLKVSCLRNLATSVSMIWICFKVMYYAGGSVLAPGKSMQADLHAPCLPYVLIIYSYVKTQTNLVNVCAQLISLRNEHFFGDTFDVLCFHMYKLQAYFENISVLRILFPHSTFDFPMRDICTICSSARQCATTWREPQRRRTEKKNLCCAFHWSKPCHDHTLDLLCFHMYKPQSNLNSRQRRKSTVATRKKEIN